VRRRPATPGDAVTRTPATPARPGLVPVSASAPPHAPYPREFGWGDRSSRRVRLDSVPHSRPRLRVPAQHNRGPHVGSATDGWDQPVVSERYFGGIPITGKALERARATAEPTRRQLASRRGSQDPLRRITAELLAAASTNDACDTTFGSLAGRVVGPNGRTCCGATGGRPGRERRGRGVAPSRDARTCGGGPSRSSVWDPSSEQRFPARTSAAARVLRHCGVRG
jgi:hypothetical protein